MKIGDKVVCVNDSSDIDGHVITVVKGRIYIVIEMWYNKPYENWGVKLKGVATIATGSGYIKASRFRKVEPFTNALTKSLSMQVLTEQKKPQIERIEIKEKEMA